MLMPASAGATLLTQRGRLINPPNRHLTVMGMLVTAAMAAQHSATSCGFAIRAAPKQPAPATLELQSKPLSHHQTTTEMRQRWLMSGCSWHSREYAYLVTWMCAHVLRAALTCYVLRLRA